MICIDLTAVHEFMRRKRLTQAKLAKLMGYHYSYIYMILAGKRQPSAQFIERLSIVMNIDMTEVFYISRGRNAQ